MLRRTFLGSGVAAMAAADRPTALCLNEDNSHWYVSRAGQRHTAESVASFVDQYAGTQVRELMLCGNSQRTSWASKVWDPVWKGYDPAGPDDQPLFRSTAAASRGTARKWVHTAWQLHEAGLDPYKIWIERARKHRMEPWISMRMNDLHAVDDPDSYLHSAFWRDHPEWRRIPWREVDWRDRALDYGRAEVRGHSFRLIEEYCERYDFDGLELDWMRFGFHFQPGREIEGGEALFGFVRNVRRLLDGWEKKRGHRIRLGARVPSRPESAYHLGMDGARWAREGLIQMLVVGPFWSSTDTDIPMEQWRRLAGPEVTLAGGIELLYRPYHAYKIQKNTLETVRGTAAAMLARGADRVYLFNYMDRDTAIDNLDDYPKLLRECGSLATLEGKARRHIVTYADTRAPGEASTAQLPKQIAAGGWASFRVATGPRVRSARLKMEIEGGGELEIRVNGNPVKDWAIPGPLEGLAVIDLRVSRAATVHWVEVAVG